MPDDPVIGVESITAMSVTIRIRLHTVHEQQVGVARELRARAVKALEAAGLSMRGQAPQVQLMKAQHRPRERAAGQGHTEEGWCTPDAAAMGSGAVAMRKFRHHAFWSPCPFLDSIGRSAPPS